jgi:CRISPR-associated protein Csm1
MERDALFPAGPEGSSTSGVYQAAVHAFLADCGRIGDGVGLLALLEKHLYAVPLHPRAPDVSLFDAARATAAIALCLNDEHAGGSWRGEDARIAAGQVESLPPPCLLVSGGLSGIQDFIFDVPRRRASKSLKGRSSFVQFAADACVRYILDALDLRDASLLYSGGGNFFLLAPASRAGSLEQVRRTLSDALLPESLALALGYPPARGSNSSWSTTSWTTDGKRRT